MKTNKYTGVFTSKEGHTYSLNVSAFSFFQAFFLLTADAIRNGSHYQLEKIFDYKNTVQVGDIMGISKLLQ